MNLAKSKFMRLFANKKTIIYLLLLALIVLAIPNAIRPLNDGLIGKETYLYLSQAEKIAQEKVLDYLRRLCLSRHAVYPRRSDRKTVQFRIHPFRAVRLASEKQLTAQQNSSKHHPKRSVFL